MSSSVQRFIRRPAPLLGVILFTVMVLFSLLGPLIVPNDPIAVNMSERLQAPSLQYPLGTDHMGRCVFSRLAAGSHTTLGITAWVVVTVMLIGIPVGLICGYFGGRLDAVIMRLADGFTALPEFILAIAIAGFLGPSLSNLMLSIVLVKWIGYARVVRGIVLSEKNKEYILAAIVSGSSHGKLLYRHLLPQVLSPVLVLAALDIGKVILTISSLSYLGLGAQPPSPEWGAMLNDGRAYFQTVPELMIYPGIAIMLVVLACHLLGEGFRDVIDVKGR